jgi:hypothetical protein
LPHNNLGVEAAWQNAFVFYRNSRPVKPPIFSSTKLTPTAVLADGMARTLLIACPSTLPVLPQRPHVTSESGAGDDSWRVAPDPAHEDLD